MQTADEAELTAAPGGALTLVLRNVSRVTTYFTGALGCGLRPQALTLHRIHVLPPACKQSQRCCACADKPERRAGSIYTAPFSTDKSFFAGRNTSNAWLGRPNAALYGLRGDAVRARSA